MTSMDGVTWSFVDDGFEFTGCRDKSTIVTKQFKEPVIARTVRVCPTQWHEHVSMKFDVFFME